MFVDVHFWTLKFVFFRMFVCLFSQFYTCWDCLTSMITNVIVFVAYNNKFPIVCLDYTYSSMAQFYNFNMFRSNCPAPSRYVMMSRKKTISRRLCMSYMFCKMNILLLYERIIFVRPHCWILKAVSGHFCLNLWLSIISIQLTYILLELSKKLIIALCPLDEQDR